MDAEEMTRRAGYRLIRGNDLTVIMTDDHKAFAVELLGDDWRLVARPDRIVPGDVIKIAAQVIAEESGDLLTNDLIRDLLRHKDAPEEMNQANWELLGDIVDAVDRLPPSYRNILHRAYFDGMTQDEMAWELDCSVSTVRFRKSKAIAALRRELLSLPTRREM